MSGVYTQIKFTNYIYNYSDKNIKKEIEFRLWNQGLLLNL